MQEFGVIMQIFQLLLKLLRLALKAVIFLGLWWFFVPIGVGLIFELITGQGVFRNEVMSGICDVLWYICYVLAPLTFIQNIVRMVKKDVLSAYCGLCWAEPGRKALKRR